VKKIVLSKRGKLLPTPVLLEIVMKWGKRVMYSLVGMDITSGAPVLIHHPYLCFGILCVAWLIEEITPYIGVEHVTECNKEEQ